jgi:RNA polymerase sigma-70 factor, ECF subfamily
VIDQLRLLPIPHARTSMVSGDALYDRERAFEHLIDEHYRAVYVLAYRMVRSEIDAADITQDVFVRAWRALPKLRADAALWSWLRKITANVCLDHIRRRRNAPPSQSLDQPLQSSDDYAEPLEIADLTSDPARLLAEDERRRILEGAIHDLAEPYRAAVLLHHIAELPVEEISAIIGVPDGTVKSRLCRARRMLRRRLAPYFDQPTD